MKLIISANNDHPFGTCVKYYQLNENPSDAKASQSDFVNELNGVRLYEIAREWLLELLMEQFSDSLSEKIMGFKLASMGKIIHENLNIISIPDIIHVLIPFRMNTDDRFERLHRFLQKHGFETQILTQMLDKSVTDHEIIKSFKLTRH